MSQTTYNVKFARYKPQSIRLGELEGFCRELESRRLLANATVRPLFPGRDDEELAGIFTIDVVGAETNLSDELAALEDVEFAQKAPSRRVLSTAA